MRRADFISAVLALKGTPFHHQGRGRFGIDCLGLVVVPALACGLQLETDRPRYSRTPNPRQLMERVTKHADQVATGSPGDLVLFAWDEKRMPQHFGVLVNEAHFAHTNAKVSKVQVEPLSGVWAECLLGFWRLHGVED